MIKFDQGHFLLVHRDTLSFKHPDIDNVCNLDSFTSFVLFSHTFSYVGIPIFFVRRKFIVSFYIRIFLYIISADKREKSGYPNSDFQCMDLDPKMDPVIGTSPEPGTLLRMPWILMV